MDDERLPVPAKTPKREPRLPAIDVFPKPKKLARGGIGAAAAGAAAYWGAKVIPYFDNALGQTVLFMIAGVVAYVVIDHVTENRLAARYQKSVDEFNVEAAKRDKAVEWQLKKMEQERDDALGELQELVDVDDQLTLTKIERDHHKAMASLANDDLADVRRVLNEETFALREALAKSDRDSKSYQFMARFGIGYPFNVPAAIENPAGLVTTRALLDVHVGLCKRAGNHGNRVLEWVTNQMGRHEPTAEGNLAGFIDDCVRRRIERAIRLLDDNKDDPRIAIVVFWARYQVVRRWIGEGLQLVTDISSSPVLKRHVPKHLSDQIGYWQWLKADTALFDDLQRLQDVEYLRPVWEYLPEGLHVFTPYPVGPSPSEPHSGAPDESKPGS